MFGLRLWQAVAPKASSWPAFASGKRWFSQHRLGRLSLWDPSLISNGLQWFSSDLSGCFYKVFSFQPFLWFSFSFILPWMFFRLLRFLLSGDSIFELILILTDGFYIERSSAFLSLSDLGFIELKFFETLLRLLTDLEVHCVFLLFLRSPVPVNFRWISCQSFWHQLRFPWRRGAQL